MNPAETDSEEDAPSQLENMSFAERLKFRKVRPGSRNVGGESSVATARANKNRPREVSSKIPVKPAGYRVGKSEAVLRARDPRFDSMCGDFDEKQFRKSYSFVNDMRQRERRRLNSALKKAKKKVDRDPENLERVRYLIQRMDNQEREWKRREAEEVKLKAEKRKAINSMLEGKKPYFMKNSEKKFENLLGTYDELKKDGKLEKRLKKKNKKNSKKPFVT